MPAHDSVSYLGHASVLVECAGARFLTDPVLRDRVGPLRRRSSPVPPRAFASIDAVLISHLHLDHLDLPSLRRLPRDVPVLVPGGGGAPLVRRQGFGRVYEIVAGETVELAGAEVTAVPAEHAGRRRPGPWSAEADALGFVIAGACRIYFAGDTDVFAGMAEFAPVDVALLPVWGWGATLGPGHMDPEAAAQALALLRPRVAVPIHWGTLFPIGLARWRSDRLTEPPHAFARHAARLAPEVQVRILDPGTTLDLREALA